MRQYAPALALLFCVLAAQGQEPRLKPPPAGKPGISGAPITITADTMEGYANQETSASGNAELRQDNLSIRADRLLYLYAADEVQAIGGVRLARGGDRMSGTGLRLRVHENIGQFDQAEYEFPRSGRGGFAPVSARHCDVIKLEGKDRYHLENATFTTCKPGDMTGTCRWAARPGHDAIWAWAQRQAGVQGHAHLLCAVVEFSAAQRAQDRLPAAEHRQQQQERGGNQRAFLCKPCA
jgi:lipopolysaccharide assembly outer membrane protein LptD (OstA)